MVAVWCFNAYPNIGVTFCGLSSFINFRRTLELPQEQSVAASREPGRTYDDVVVRPNSPALLIFGRFGASALALVSAPIVARAIGPEGRGETAAAVALFALVPILLGIGLPLELRRVVAADGDASSLHSARRFIGLTAFASIPVSVLCTMTIFSNFESTAKIVATMGVALTPITLSWICDISVLVARQDYRGIVVLQLLQPLVYLIGVTVLWATNGATTTTVILVYIVSNFMPFVFGLWRVRASLSSRRGSAGQLFRGSMKFAGGSIAEAASNRLDQVIALPIIGAAQSGFYSVGVTVGFAPLAIAQALGTATFTGIAQAQGRRRRRLINSSIRQVASLSFVSSVILFLVGPFLVVLLFGEAFQGADAAIRVAAVACLMASISLQASTVLIATGHGTKLSISQLVSLVIGIALLFLLGPSLGALGAAIASLIGYATMAGLSLAFCGASLLSVFPTPQSFLAGIKSLFRAK